MPKWRGHEDEEVDADDDDDDDDDAVCAHQEDLNVLTKLFDVVFHPL